MSSPQQLGSCSLPYTSAELETHKVEIWVEGWLKAIVMYEFDHRQIGTLPGRSCQSQTSKPNCAVAAGKNHTIAGRPLRVAVAFSHLVDQLQLPGVPDLEPVSVEHLNPTYDFCRVGLGLVRFSDPLPMGSQVGNLSRLGCVYSPAS